MVEGEERMIAFGNDVFLRNGWVDDSLRKWDGFLRNFGRLPPMKSAALVMAMNFMG